MTSAGLQDGVIVGLGEVLWDVFPDGARFGGAPANFACGAAGLAGGAARVYMASAVGSDSLGVRALDELAAHGVDTTCVARLAQPTGQVLVQVDGAGHASYEFAADTAWDNLQWTDSLQQLASSARAVCFGSLGQRSEPSRQVIQRFVQQTPADCLRIFDVNLRPPFWSKEVLLQSLPLANVVKCNEDELPVLAEMLQLGGAESSLLAQLVERHELQLAALTRGAHGSLLVHASGASSDLPGVSTAVADTVGAGDSFTAALALGLLQGLPLRAIHQWAAEVAALVCSQPGANPEFPERLHLPR